MKKNYKSPEEKMIRRKMLENDIEYLTNLAELTGINIQTLKSRIKDPGTLKVFEIRSLDRVLHFSDADRLLLVRG